MVATFRLRPDATVVSAAGAVEFVLDAKWKHLETGTATLGVAREDAYQLAAYAGAYRCRLVALVYPRAEGLPTGLVGRFELRLPGDPRIDVYTVDLVATTRGAPLPAGLCPTAP